MPKFGAGKIKLWIAFFLPEGVITRDICPTHGTTLIHTAPFQPFVNDCHDPWCLFQYQHPGGTYEGIFIEGEAHFIHTAVGCVITMSCASNFPVRDRFTVPFDKHAENSIRLFTKIKSNVRRERV